MISLSKQREVVRTILRLCDEGKARMKPEDVETMREIVRTLDRLLEIEAALKDRRAGR